MNALLVITLALGLAAADIGIGYNYKVPHTSYGVPSYQYTSSAGNTNTGHYAGNVAQYDVDQSGHSGAQGFGQQSSSYHSTYKPFKSHGSQYYETGASNSGFNTGANSGYPNYQYTATAAQGGQQGFKQYQSQYQSSAVQKYQEYYNQQQEQPAQVFKHFYVHAAPEEPEAPKFRQTVALPPPQKHYKIIFIKTPTQPAPAPQFVPVSHQNEEKTIVYVLVKKPEEAQQIELPKVEQKPPSKPEVFFIKYNNKDDSQAVINNIVNDYNKGEHVSFSGANVVSGGANEGNTPQYDTSSSGQYSHGSVSGLYQAPAVSDQFSGSGQYSQSTGGSFGSQSSGQVTTVTQTAPSSYETSDGGASTSGASSSTNVNYDNIISTSQGVPHQSYGPPNFRS